MAPSASFAPSRAAGRAPSGDPAVQAVRAALEGPLVELFRRELPVLRTLPRGAAYNTVMGDPRLLDECLRLFRSRPDLFAELVHDSDRRPVTHDDAMLSCGRTLGDAVALVVRAAARRQFRARLDTRVRPAVPRPRLSPLRRLGVALGLARRPAPPAAARAPSRSDQLYRAIRDYLRFDWQVPLIPHYAPLAPATVADLGARLLDIREAAELRALSAPGSVPRDGRPPLLLDGARRVMQPGRDSIDPEVLWRVVQQMDLARLFPKTEADRVRRAMAQVSATHADVIRALLPALGADVRRFVAFLVIAYVTVGEQRFKQDFCQEGRAHAARKLAERLEQLTPPAPSLDEMTRFYQAVLGTAYAGGVETGASGEALLQAHPQLVHALDALGRSSAAPVAISG